MKVSLRFWMTTAIFLIACQSPAQKNDAQVQLEVAFPNLSFTRPVDLQHPGDGTNRLFVLEQAGRIFVFENNENTNSRNLFLDIRHLVDASGNEEGLLGLAFHPDYRNNGYFYVDYTASNPERTVISRYRVSDSNPDSADENSALIILEVGQPYSNHNGGQISFGPDDYLYIALGDGGSGGDPQGNGQNRQTLLGSILRIDVDNPEGDKNYGIPPDNPFAGNTNGWQEEIYAYGLRNPWRFSFDPKTNWLWTADVGQNQYEEIDIIEKEKNYGWNIMEGFHCYQASDCDTTGLTMPIHEYSHSLGQSVTGGFVYRGNALPELVGKYIYADYVSGRIWSLEYDGRNPPVNTELIDSDLNIASFGVDQNNELFICAFDGKIHRFKATATQTGEKKSDMPKELRLGRNYPNPFNPATTIPFSLNKSQHIEISIYNALGQRVNQLFNGVASPGHHHAVWDGKNDAGEIQPSGPYFYQLKSGTVWNAIRRMVLVR